MDYKKELIQALQDYKELAREHVELLKRNKTIWHYPQQAPYIEPYRDRRPYWSEPLITWTDNTGPKVLK